MKNDPLPKLRRVAGSFVFRMPWIDFLACHFSANMGRVTALRLQRGCHAEMAKCWSNRVLTRNVPLFALNDKRTGFRLRARVPQLAVQVQVLSPALIGQGFASHRRPLPISFLPGLFPPTWQLRGTIVGSGPCSRTAKINPGSRVDVLSLERRL